MTEQQIQRALILLAELYCESKGIENAKIEVKEDKK